METRRRETIGGGWPLYALLGLLLSTTVSRSSALSVNVFKEECVYEYAFAAGDLITGNFVVVDHEHFWNNEKHPGVDVTVTSSKGNIVHSIKGSTSGKFQVKAPENGMYKLCFHNPQSAPESVSFSFHIGHIPNEHDLAKDEHLDPINVRITELREKMEYVTLEQRFLKARDLSHWRVNQSTRKRVIFYTVGEYMLLVLVSGLQVAYVRRLFSNKKSYTRV